MFCTLTLLLGCPNQHLAFQICSLNHILETQEFNPIQKGSALAVIVVGSGEVSEAPSTRRRVSCWIRTALFTNLRDCRVLQDHLLTQGCSGSATEQETCFLPTVRNMRLWYLWQIPSLNRKISVWKRQDRWCKKAPLTPTTGVYYEIFSVNGPHVRLAAGNRSFCSGNVDASNSLHTYRKLMQPVPCPGASHVNESWWWGVGERCQWMRARVERGPNGWWEPIVPREFAIWDLAACTPISQKPSKFWLEVMCTETTKQQGRLSAPSSRRLTWVAIVCHVINVVWVGGQMLSTTTTMKTTATTRTGCFTRCGIKPHFKTCTTIRLCLEDSKAVTPGLSQQIDTYALPVFTLQLLTRSLCHFSPL